MHCSLFWRVWSNTSWAWWWWGFTGYTITDIRPDYVVVGETKNYNIDRMEKAINLVRYRRRATPPTCSHSPPGDQLFSHDRNGAKLIGTNCDLLDKSVTGFLPACGTLVAPIVLVGFLCLPPLSPVVRAHT